MKIVVNGRPHKLLACKKWGIIFLGKDETVKAAKKFLEEHPEEQKKVTPMGATSGQPGWVAISKFLGWPEHRVRHSLERLGLIMVYALPNYPLQELKTISIRGVEGSLNNVESEHEGRNEQEEGEF